MLDPQRPPKGSKSTSTLLGHFGDMDSLYARLEEVQHLSIRGAKSLQKKLQDNRDAAELAGKLTVIETAVESTLVSPDLRRNEIDSGIWPGINHRFHNSRISQYNRPDD